MMRVTFPVIASFTGANEIAFNVIAINIHATVVCVFSAFKDVLNYKWLNFPMNKITDC